MNREWKPGDVAVDGAGNRLMCAERVDGSLVWMNVFGGFYPIDGLIEDARPLVVIDNEFDRTMVKHLRIAAEDNSALTTIPWLADQIEQQVRPKPPRPDEPQGLGAVVEDIHGRRYQRVDRDPAPWLRSDIAPDAAYDWRDYDQINAVRVLSPGVEVDQ